MFKRFLMILSFLTQPVPVMAQDFSLAPFRQEETVANFPLTEEILVKIEKIQDELLDAPLEGGISENGVDTGIDSLAAALEKQPIFMSIIRNHQLSARDYVTASMALSTALEAALAENEEQILNDTPAVSKENLAFGKKYINRIRMLLDR